MGVKPGPPHTKKRRFIECVW